VYTHTHTHTHRVKQSTISGSFFYATWKQEFGSEQAGNFGPKAREIIK